MTVTEPQPITIETSGILFDLDGTLMLSTNCVEMFWYDFGKTHGIDAHEMLKTSHGRRTIDLLAEHKPEMATPEISGELEGTIPVRWKEHARPVPGVQQFVKSLPPSQWGIVTSGTKPLAGGWLTHFLEWDEPTAFITAEAVPEGKPHPAGYKMGKEQLKLDDFLVFEDAPAGIKAGLDAGATVIGMATTYDAPKVKAAGAHHVLTDLTQVKVEKYDPKTKRLTLTLYPTL